MTVTEHTQCTDTAAPVDHLRPFAHFTTPSTWINDPNGLLFHKGVWHLFFQNNPVGSTWGSISWGHATSRDLTTWEHQDVAIPATDTEMAFSGSAVADTANTSGLGGPGETPLVAIYTSCYYGDHPRAGVQSQSLAYSVDEGRTWQRYAGNPVLDIDSTEFRDPKVFWYGGEEDGHWVMVLVEATEHRVAIYTSPNLIDWTLASRFGPLHATGGVWECPDLFELPLRGTDQTRWVMLVSLNPGGIAGGSGMQYFVGDFDGMAFTPEHVAAGTELADFDWLDYGRDYYAGVSFSGVPDGRRVTVAWASNWDYANETPTRPWRSALSLPRELELVRWADGRPRIVQHPILPEEGSAAEAGLVVHRLVVPTGRGERTEIELSTTDGQDRVVLTVDGDAHTLTCDRTRSGDVDFHPKFPSVDVAPLPSAPATELAIVVDGCVLEVYAAGGRVTLTQLVFPRSPLTQLTQRQVETS